MGPTPTPWAAIDRYAQRYSITGENFEMLVYCLRKLDMALQEHQEKEQEQKDKVRQQREKRQVKK